MLLTGPPQPWDVSHGPTRHLDAGQDHPGERKGPGKPVQSSVQGSHYRARLQLDILLVGHQAVDDEAGHGCRDQPQPRHHDGVEGDGEAGLVPQLVEEVAQTKADQVGLVPGMQGLWLGVYMSTCTRAPHRNPPCKL